MNRVIRFSRDWISPVDQHRTFALLTEGFRDSALSPVWPRELAESRLLNESLPRLERGTRVDVTYKFGPLKMTAPYRLAEVLEPRYIQYESVEGHPLVGGGRITLRALYGGKCLCKWEGGYRAKELRGVVALTWFKLYFEKRFFEALIGRFRALESALRAVS